jgi:hypothetical protein|tara:strand:+ start:888 stop:1259 length:372 start_codon:yes stop_codon:yes gene_type:complete
MLDKLKKMFDKGHVPASVSKDKGTDAKAKATKEKKPYVEVLETKLDPKNPRNGFFELDWNEYFVRDLRLAGYQGDSEEAIVDAWFKELCGNIAKDQGVATPDTPMGAGYINTKNIGDGKSEIS